MGPLEIDRKVAAAAPDEPTYLYMGLEPAKKAQGVAPAVDIQQLDRTLEPLSSWGKLSFLDKVIVSLSRGLIYIITHIRAPSSKSDNTTKALSSHLWSIYRAEHSLELSQLRINRGPAALDAVLKPAQREFFQTALDMAPTQFAREKQQINTDLALKLMDAIVWSKNQPNDISTLRRVYRNKITGSQAEELLPELGAQYDQLQRTFFAFRQALVNHQNSLNRVWAGVQADKELQEALANIRIAWVQVFDHKEFIAPFLASKEELKGSKID